MKKLCRTSSSLTLALNFLALAGGVALALSERARSIAHASAP